MAAAAKKDPLLTTAKVVIVIGEIGLVFSMVVMAIGIAGMLTVGRAQVLADLAANAAPAGSFAALVGVLATVIGVLFLSLCFLIQLKRIIGSVHGDPFMPQNAKRLARMGWYALGVQALSMILAWIARYYGPYVDGVGGDNIMSGIVLDPPLTGLFLALVLFILARVFRKGTEMREDLEGTV